MDKPGQIPKDPRDLMLKAERAAARKDVDTAIRLIEECILEYSKKHKPFKAVAVSRKAKTLLGTIPKASSLIIRSYTAAGLIGDAMQEYEAICVLLKKDTLQFFAALEKEAFVDLLGIMDVATYPKGRTVLKQHDSGMDIFVVLSGSCEVLRDANRLSVMKPGDVFGEIGFFARTGRSATVKTLEDSSLAIIPAGPLYELKGRHLCLRQILESIYSERILKKVAEDLEKEGATLKGPEIIATLHYAKGEEIPVNPKDSMAIIKHGIVEVDYDEMCLMTKKYLKPGAVISNRRIRARASTNVVIVLTGIH